LNLKKNYINAGLSSWLLLFFLSLIWGSSFILIKKSLLAFSPLEVGALRICIASIAFLPFLLRQLKDVPWNNLRYFIIVGFAGSGIPAFLYAIAQTEVDSSVAGVLNSLTPIFTLLIGLIIFKATFKWLQLWGILLGFLGACLLIILRNGWQLSAEVNYALLIVVATLCYGISVNVVNYKLSAYKPLLISSISFILTGPLSFIYLLTTDILTDVTQHPDGYVSLISIAVLSLVGTFYSTIIFYKLVQNTNPVFASSVSFVIPIIALLWGYVDGEILSIYHVISMACILVGVLFIRKAK